jgi:hypothetical protein
MGGIKTRKTSKFEGILTMRRTCLIIAKSSKAEGKLLVTSRTMGIK